jgi:NAD(P)-dependent dehydrogenase (short-subunit alcohol dehydrogenase family)
MRLSEKTIIITGASSGIGASATRLFASEGANFGYQLKPKQADSARGWAEVTEKTVVAWVAP